MKKLKLLAFAFVAFLFAGFIRVNAIHIDELIPYPESNIEVEEQDDGSYLLTLTDDATLDIIIQNGEVATLDLNGHKLVNFTPACEAIKVEKGGTLTITDSSNGNGVVTQRDDSTYSVITNLGTLNIKAGTFKTDSDLYVIRNEANMTISGGNFVSTSNKTSLVGNIQYVDKNVTPRLTVSGGNFEANQDALKNYENSIVNITGGEFTSKDAFALDNSGYASVTGGELTSVNNAAVRFQIDSTKENESSLKIDGATLNSKEGVSDLSIYDKALSKNVTDDYNTTIDENGNVILKEKKEDVTTTTVATTTQKAEENPKTSDNVLTFLILGIASLIGVCGSSIIIKKKMNA